MADHLVDLVQEGADLGVRLGELAASGLRARQVGTARRVTVATPAYLARRGTPAEPKDLARHDCVLFTGLTTPDRWVYAGSDGPASVQVNGVFRCNSSEGARAAVCAGLGVGYHPAWLFDGDLARGTVVPVLERFTAPALPINVLFPPGRYVAAKTRAFVDHVVRVFDAHPALRRG